MISNFVFLEVKDRPAVDLLSSVRSILRQRESKSPIHITVQGPYKHRPTDDKLAKMWEVIQGEGLLLHGIGKFEFPDRHVVFLRSHSKAIRKIWFKRDFPIIRYGFNPHITLFEGSPAQAKAVETFLRAERIELYCRQFSLSLYQTWNNDLFSSPVHTVVHATEPTSSNPLIQPYRWRDGLQSRARALVEDVIRPLSVQPLDLQEL